MHQKKKSRIKDIAERAGVSIGTVDRVIHNRAEVSGETADRVRTIMREMNYEPDILARTLVSKKIWNFAALLPGTFHEVNFWQKPLDGIQRAIREISHFGVHFEPFLFDIYDRQTFVDLGQQIIKRKPDGLIIAPVFARDSFRLIGLCKDLQIPVVLINSEIKVKYPLSFIGQDSWQSGRVAAHLLNNCTKQEAEIGVIHLVKELGEQKHIAERERGFRDYFSDHQLLLRKIHPALTIADYNEENTNSSVLDYLKRFPGIESIFVSNSNVGKVARCLEKNLITHIRMTGYDLVEENIKYLKNGYIDFLIGQKPEEQGYRGIMTLFNVLVLKKNAENRQFLPIDIILKENLIYHTS